MSDDVAKWASKQQPGAALKADPIAFLRAKRYI